MKKRIVSKATAHPRPWITQLRILCAAALLAALSIVLGKYLQIPIGNSLRVSFENLPVLIAGIFFGPFVGCAVGVVADLVGCVMVGFTINPIITAGAALVGLLSGMFTDRLIRQRKPLPAPVIYIAVLVAHVVGSMLVKSLGLRLAYSTPMSILIWRIPIYLTVGALEGTIIWLLAKSRIFTGELNRLLNRTKRK